MHDEEKRTRFWMIVAGVVTAIICISGAFGTAGRKIIYNPGVGYTYSKEFRANSRTLGREEYFGIDPDDSTEEEEEEDEEEEPWRTRPRSEWYMPTL